MNSVKHFKADKQRRLSMNFLKDIARSAPAVVNLNIGEFGMGVFSRLKWVILSVIALVTAAWAAGVTKITELFMPILNWVNNFFIGLESSKV